MATTIKIPAPDPKIEDNINHVLGLLDNFTQELSKNIGLSRNLLTEGLKTELSVQIEQSLKNPADILFKVKNDIDHSFKTIINAYASVFFKANSDVIHAAFRTKTNYDDLHYCIALKKDTSSNRNKIFSFLRDYNTLEYAHSYPVYFQFVPKKLAMKIEKTEDIINGEIS